MRFKLFGASVAALSFLFSSAGSFAAGFASLPPDVEQNAYSNAMLCFVTNGVASNQRNRAGDPSKAELYDKQAREAFDIASTAGQHLGYSKTRMESDFAKKQSEELPKMVKDQNYFYVAVAHCKALGLM